MKDGRKPSTARELTAAQFVVQLTSALRFYQLPEVPPGLQMHEGFRGVVSRWIFEGAPLRLFWGGDMVREPIAMYLVTVALGFAGREPWGIRLPSAVMGARTVLADARPGEYPLGAGMYALVPLERLSATDAKGQLLQDNAVVSGSSQVEH